MQHMHICHPCWYSHSIIFNIHCLCACILHLWFESFATILNCQTGARCRCRDGTRCTSWSCYRIIWTIKKEWYHTNGTTYKTTTNKKSSKQLAIIKQGRKGREGHGTEESLRTKNNHNIDVEQRGSQNIPYYHNTLSTNICMDMYNAAEKKNTNNGQKKKGYI